MSGTGGCAQFSGSPYPSSYIATCVAPLFHRYSKPISSPVLIHVMRPIASAVCPLFSALGTSSPPFKTNRWIDVRYERIRLTKLDHCGDLSGFDLVNVAAVIPAATENCSRMGLKQCFRLQLRNSNIFVNSVTYTGPYYTEIYIDDLP